MIQIGRLAPGFILIRPNVFAPSVWTLLTTYNDIVARIPEDQRENVFFSLANHRGVTAEMTAPTRSIEAFDNQDNLFWDFDGADISKPYEYQAILASVLQVPKESILVVCSGNGLHFYVFLQTPIREARYFDDNRSSYHRINELIGVKLAESSLPGYADNAVFDAPRIARLPGTLNKKKDKPPKIVTLVHTPIECVRHEINLGKLSGVEELRRENISPQEIRRQFPTPDFKEIIKSCGAFTHALENPNSVWERVWFDFAGILACMPPDATVIWHDKEYTAEDLARYLFDKANSNSLRATDFDKKWRSSKEFGARKCSTIAKHSLEQCQVCPHYNKISSPLALKSTEHLGSQGNGFWVATERTPHSHPHYGDLAKYFRQRGHLVVTPEERIFTYEGSKYIETKPMEIKSWIEATVVPSDPLREMHRNEFLNKVKALYTIGEKSVDELFEKSIFGKINFKNGIMNITTGEFEPHSKYVGFMYTLPYDYKPGAKSELLLEWLAKITCDRPELMEALLDAMAYPLWPRNEDNLVVYLIGEGANGKSTFLSLIQAVVGEDNFSAVSIHQLTTNKFAPAALEGKLVNLSGEDSGKSLSKDSLNILKALSGNDAVHVEKKGENGYPFINKAKLIFSANEPPRFEENNQAVRRRFLVIPFDFKLKREEQDSRIAEQLIADVENITPMLVERLRENYLKNGRFICSRGGYAAEKAQEKILSAGNTVVEWSKENVLSSVEYDDDTFLPLQEAYAEYSSWCGACGYKNAANIVSFSRSMREFVVSKALKDQIVSRRVSGKVVKAFARTRFRKAEDYEEQSKT